MFTQKRHRLRFSIVLLTGGLFISIGTTAWASDREKLVSEFPADVQSLLTPDIPDAVVEALLKVRKSGPDTLVQNDSGGELFKGQYDSYIANWERLTGWKVQNIAPSSDPGQIKAQVESGNPQFDIFETGSIGDAMNEEKAGLLAPFDMNLLGPVFDTFPKAAGYKHTKHWVQFGYFGVLLVWDSRKWPVSGPHPSTPNDLFDTGTFPGKRCLYKFPEYAGTLEYALLADGVAPDKLYPLDVDRALKKLETIKDDTVWWNTGAESVQHIVSGNCAMGVTWHGRPALRLKQDPTLPIAVSWKGTLLIDNGWAIPKGAKNIDAANSLLAFAFTPQNQCRFLNALGYGIPIDDTCLDDFGKTWGVTQEHLAVMPAAQDPAYYSEHIKELIDKFNEWLSS